MIRPTAPTPFDVPVDQLVPRLMDGAQALTPQFLEALAAIAPTSIDGEDLAEHGRDWWPIAIGWAAAGQVPALASVIVRPTSAQQVAQILGACNEARVPVTPMAGRSGVCGGSIPLRGGVALDLCELNQVHEVDEISETVTVDAGMFGPDLEAHLAGVGPGYSVGHFPQSFDLSTVGGWLACRGAGQYSTRYGKIEDMVVALTVALPDGRLIETAGTAPRSATGPSLTQLFVGSEGTLGVITSATLKLHRKASAEARRVVSFATFDDGLEACRRILQRGATPAVLRLYDVIESKRSFEVEANVLIVLDEADPHLLAATMSIVDEELAGATQEDLGHVDHWLGSRNNVSQLAPLWRNHVVVDTIEISGSWKDLGQTTERLLATLRETPGTLTASVHQSHAYSDGACCYFTFAGRPTAEDGENQLEAEANYYQRVWTAANACIIAEGRAVSHHHGVGLHRADALVASLGSAHDVLQQVKDALDPNGIMNPGKLGLSEVAR
jgi:alkyldihydroxyacetonephosphate synthase